MSAWRTDKLKPSDGNVLAVVNAVIFGRSYLERHLVRVSDGDEELFCINGVGTGCDIIDIVKWCPLSEVERLIEEAR